MIKKTSKKATLPPRRRQESVGDVRRAKSEARRHQQPNTFLRNRTFTGSSSQKVQSAETSSDIESPRARAHRLAARQRRLGIILVSLLSASVMVFLLIYQFVAVPRVEIKNQKEAVTQIDTKPYATAISSYFAHNPLQRFRFSLNKTALATAIGASYPEVDQVVEVKPSALGVATFVISLRQPVAVWQIDGTDYFVDQIGSSFKNNFFAKPDITVTDNSGARVKQGDTLTSSTLLSFIGKIITGAREFGYKAQTVSLPANTTRQVVITFADHSPQIVMSIDRPVGEQLEDMSVALKYLDKNNIHPGYIDVRVSGKAFYK